MSIDALWSWERRLGKIGESAVQTRLAYFSTTNKITDDIGLDFYCELLSNGRNYEFHVQAKGTQHFDRQWGASVKNPP